MGGLEPLGRSVATLEGGATALQCEDWLLQGMVRIWGSSWSGLGACMEGLKQ